MLHRKQQSGFSLVELLVVITIVGLLAGLVLNGVVAAREAAARMTCGNNQRQVALAAISFEATHQHWPAGRLGCDDTGEMCPEFSLCPPDMDPKEKSGASGFVSLLPWLEEQPLHDALGNGKNLWNDNTNDLEWYRKLYRQDAMELLHAVPTLLVCPKNPSEELNEIYVPVKAAAGSYAFVHGVLGADAYMPDAKFHNTGMFVFKLTRRSAHVRDGLSKTAMLGEVTFPQSWESSNIWTYAMLLADSMRSTRNPLNTPPGQGIAWQTQNGAFGSHHGQGANFAYGDGHVEFVNDDIDRLVYNQQATIQQSMDKLIKLD